MSTAAAEKRVRCMKWVPKQEAGGSATIKACTSKRKRASSTAPASGSSPETPLPEDDKDGVDEQLESVGRSRSARKKPDLASGNDETVDVDDGEQDAGDRRSRSSQKRAVPAKKSKKKGGDDDVEHCFVGEPVPDDEAKKRWPERYQRKNAGKRAFAYGSTKKGDEEEELKARCHYWQAMVDNANLTQSKSLWFKT